jgi:hypothetical protein
MLKCFKVSHYRKESGTDYIFSPITYEYRIIQSSSSFPFRDDDGRILRYSKYNVDVSGFTYEHYNTKQIELDNFVTFGYEPDNKDDSNAIAVFFDDQKIGYIPKNSLQSLIKEYSDGATHQICGFISYINERFNEVHLSLGFYSAEYDDFTIFTCKLNKTQENDFLGNPRQRNLSAVSEKCPVKLEYNYDSRTYLVSDDMGDELGEISRKQTNEIYKTIGDSEPFHAEISDLDMDGDGYIACTVEVWCE